MDNIGINTATTGPKEKLSFSILWFWFVIAVTELFLILQKSGGLPSAATIEENEVVEESTEMGMGRE